MPHSHENSWLRGIYKQHWTAVMRVASRSGLPEADVEEVACEVFQIASRRRAEIEPGCDRQFLQAVAKRVASACRRNQKRRLAAHCEFAADRALHTMTTPELLVDAHRACELIEQACSGLPSRQQEVFRLMVLEERTAREVAVALRLKESTATSNLRRARESFRRELKRGPARSLLRDLGIDVLPEARE